MNGDNLHHRYPTSQPQTTNFNFNFNGNHHLHTPTTQKTTTIPTPTPTPRCDGNMLGRRTTPTPTPTPSPSPWRSLRDAEFMKWTLADVSGVFKYHPIPCFFGACLLFFMGVEYTLRMIPASSPPYDLGFVATSHLHRIISSSPTLNTLLAALNTVFVGMQTVYIIGAFLVEGRARATIAAMFMFTCRGILGYSTQLPLPQGFLGSGADFPVGNVSFFLFYSGHVAGSVIASLDMRRMQRWKLAYVFDALNVLQVVRLLSTRGHYTIDLAVGVGAGMLFDSLAGNYVQGNSKKKKIGGAAVDRNDITSSGDCRAFFAPLVANGSRY